VAPGAYASRVDDAEAALTHIHSNLLGLPALKVSMTLDRKASSLQLPSTAVFSRPSSAMVVVADELQSVLDDASQTVAFEASDAAMQAYERSAGQRTGLAASSFELLQRTPQAGIVDAFSYATWDSKLGFVPHSAEGYAADVDGRLACSEAGRVALQGLGLVAEETNKRCPSYHFELEHPLADVQLDSNAEAICQALSEAAAAVVVSDRMASADAVDGAELAEKEQGLLLLRLHVSGASEVASKYGPSSKEYTAVAKVLRAALRKADATLATLEASRGGRYVSVAMSSELRLNQRRLQPIEGGADNEVSPTPSPSPQPGRGPTTTYTTAEVGDYHVILWTAVLLGAVTLGVLYFMVNMEGRKDPALYSQIADNKQSKPSGR
jgi:hypothetical protein